MKSTISTPEESRHPRAKSAAARKAVVGTPKPARRTQEERTREAKERLLKAAVQVLLVRGYNGFSTKEVVDCAGLSKGALIHHFPNKEELVVAATASVYEEAIANGKINAKSEASRRDPVKGYISECASVYFQWPFLVALEIVMVARTDRALMDRIAPVIAHYREMTDQLWTEVLIETGMPRQKAVRLLKLTLNVVRGMALGEIWQGDPTDRERSLNEWAKYAAQIFVVAAKS